MDEAGRWNISTELSQNAGFLETKAFLMVGNTAWLEIWVKDERQKRMQELMKCCLTDSRFPDVSHGLPEAPKP
jgi:DNA-binding transcriptional regulator/RsmH inhibitor MraZ